MFEEAVLAHACRLASISARANQLAGDEGSRMHKYSLDVAAFINKNDELQAENVALVAHSNAVTLNVAELTSYSNAVVPLVNELQAQNAELTSYSNAIAPLINQ
eukprot:gene2849-4919_t